MAMLAPPKVRGTMPTAAECPLLLGPLLDRGAAIQPTTEILTKIEGGYRTTTYREHRRQVAKIAAAMLSSGLQEGDVVSSYLWNTAEHYVLYHALPSIGLLFNVLNIRLSDPETAWIVDDSGTRMIFADEDLLPRVEAVFAGFADKCSKVEKVVACGFDGKRWQNSGSPLPGICDWSEFLALGGDGLKAWPVFHEDSAAFLCYTSGTTGNPKGIAYSHRSTYVHVIGQGHPDMCNMSGSDTVLPVVPMFHAAGWCVPLVGLMLGCKMVLPNRFMDPPSIAQTIIETGTTFSAGVPVIWQMLRTALEANDASMKKVNGVLKTLICGGSAPPLELMLWFKDKLGVTFRHIWGMTETNPLGTVSIPVATQADLSKSIEEQANNLKSQGVPYFTVQTRLVDPDDFSKDIPKDGQSTGELLVKGPTVTCSYWKGMGKDKFHEGYLATGDVSSITETEVMQIRDRSKDLVKSGGEFISSVDLENTITSLPSVQAACVVAFPHPKWDERPIAIVVPLAGKSAPSKDEVCKHLEGSNFAKFQWPDDVLVWDAIPMTGTGKMDKKTVRQKLKDMAYVLPDQRTSKL